MARRHDGDRWNRSRGNRHRVLYGAKPYAEHHGAVIRAMRKERTDDIFGESISEATALATSVEKHRPILDYAPNSKSANELLDITSEFLERLGDAP
jgi:cellulose biosynthesis protein BcsQ